MIATTSRSQPPFRTQHAGREHVPGHSYSSITSATQRACLVLVNKSIGIHGTMIDRGREICILHAVRKLFIKKLRATSETTHAQNSFVPVSKSSWLERPGKWPSPIRVPGKTTPKMRGKGGRGQGQTTQSIRLSLPSSLTFNHGVTSPDQTFVPQYIE